MKLSMNWLKDFVDESFDIKEYCDAMTLSGSKVEGYDDLAAEISGVVVGKVLAMERHPDSDHLWICQVDVGKDEPVQIITGAQNVKVGDLVPAALHEAHLPGGVVIKNGKLRGLPSNGMLCSLGELGLTKNDFPYAAEDGIFLIEEDCKVGDDIRDVLSLRDYMVEFEITSNRPDCLSVIGLARETAATFDKKFNLKAPVVKALSKSGKTADDYIKVEVRDSRLCPRYTARVVENVKIEPSPKWLRARLRASGVRPINNIVDITNYVCLEYGQPMHAFDYNYLEGGKIIVRHADEGEVITTLDGEKRTLTEKMLVIADEKKAVAVAGVMGGENSEIIPETKTIVFESANFNGPSVRTTARDIGLRTEASGRYEKGLDRENTLPAIERACELIELLGAGDVVPGIIDIFPEKEAQRVIPFDPEKINAFLGTDVPVAHMKDTFRKLEIKLEDGKLYPPSFRADLEGMHDIAEEVIRIYGFDKIPTTNFHVEAAVGGRTARQKKMVSLNNMLTLYGFFEVQTFSFMSRKYYDNINLPADAPERDSIVISNPLGEDTSIMRTTAVPSVLEVLATNRRHRNKTCAIYENAKIYRKVEGKELPNERISTVIASYECGDFFAMKGIAERVLGLFGITETEAIRKTDISYLHPGRAAALIDAEGNEYCVFGELHPNVSRTYGFDVPVYVCVCDTEALLALEEIEKKYVPLPKFPSVERDLAFVCDEELASGDLKKAIKKYGGKTLVGVEIFDIYRDAKLGENKKSMAYTITLRSNEKTLEDADCDKIVTKILNGLEHDFGVTLRS